MKRLLFVTLIMYVVFILVGCGSAQSSDVEITADNTDLSSSTSDKNMALAYYTKDGFLTPIAFNTETTEPQVNTALKLLFSVDTPEGFENKLADVKLNSFTVNGDTISIDVSEEFLKVDKADLAKNQIIYTLTECENIFKVNITVEGEPHETLLERPPYINLKNPVEYEKDKKNPEEMSKYLTIYYIDKDIEYLIPVTVKSDKFETKTENSDKPFMVKAEDKTRAVLQHLIQEITKIENFKTFEDKTIKSLRLDDGIAVVDLDQNMLIKFINEKQYAEILVESIARTLTAIDEIDKVQFLINGKNIGNVTSNLSLENPIKPDRWYNILIH
ncbi:MAG: GerMN domain-containing protein [Tepidanaerobacteraceae bacterium]|nr:GerMN domain-containing protein [Tepidanaerobacteraceae bacterium]